MKQIICTYKNIVLIAAAAASLVGGAFAIDGRYAKADIETTVMDIKRIVCLSAIDRNIKEAKIICIGLIKQ